MSSEIETEGECPSAACQQIAATASDVYCQITGGLLSYPTYDARTILSHAEDETQRLVEEEGARVRAEERGRLGSFIHELLTGRLPDEPDYDAALRMLGARLAGDGGAR